MAAKPLALNKESFVLYWASVRLREIAKSLYYRGI